MNDQELRALLQKDKSIPAPPKNELHNIHQKIEDQSFSLDFFIQRKGLIFASLFVSLLFINQLSTNNQKTINISEDEQRELIEYYLENNYLDNIEVSYAWVEAEDSF